MDISTSVAELKGVGPELATRMGRLGVHTVGDLLTYYPRRYDDYSSVTAIGRLKPGMVTIRAQIRHSGGRYGRRSTHISEAIASDATGSVRLVWFNQPYRLRSIKANEEYFISGEFALRHQRLGIVSPSIEPVSSFPVNTARIIPVYRETKGLKSSAIRKLITQLLPLVRSMPEVLPEEVVASNGLIPRNEAIRLMHFPDSMEGLLSARLRLGFEEVFALSLTSLLNRREQSLEQTVSIPFREEVAREFVSHLPFTLTEAQRRAVWHIYQDMTRTNPMNRLLEGDVGSGKTVVAAMAAIMAMCQGFQVALMAPTELLARQHADTIYDLLAPLGLQDQVGLVIGALPPSQKTRIRSQIVEGKVKFIIGTHALIQDKIDMHKLGLVIIDEQHRFGVEQRKKLQAKAGHMPHVLSMTATPIPRSLALTLYGELDISVIASKPPGRLPVITRIVSPNSRRQLYEGIDAEISKGRQVFWVCPLITEQELLPDDRPLKSAENLFDELSKGAMKHRRISLLHGKMKAPQKEQVMRDFMAHKTDILVATTVIEVGVNVPNASMMVIENAERFGLAQIHQLRGRVGRSSHQGYCYLMMSDSREPTRRLRALESSSDGFALAELDLEIRGPGAIYGTMQHGQLDLRVAKLSDTALIEKAQQSARRFLDSGDDLLQYPYLNAAVSRLRAVTNLN